MSLVFSMFDTFFCFHLGVFGCVSLIDFVDKLLEILGVFFLGWSRLLILWAFSESGYARKIPQMESLPKIPQMESLPALMGGF